MKKIVEHVSGNDFCTVVTSNVTPTTYTRQACVCMYWQNCLAGCSKQVPNFSSTRISNSRIYSENPAQSAKAALGDLPNAGVFEFRITEQIWRESKEISNQHWQILDLKINPIVAINDDKEKKSINKRTPNLQYVKSTTLSNLKNKLQYPDNLGKIRPKIILLAVSTER